MLRKRKRIDKRLMSLTLKYSKNHPEIINGAIIPGRISVIKRAEHIKKITTTLIRDKKLTDIINSPLKNSELQVSQMAQHLKTRFKNTSDAVKYINSLQARLRYATGEKSIFSSGYLKKLAKRKNLSPQNTNMLQTETTHMVLPPIMGTIALLGLTKEKLLEK